jgi:hypothetical protein
MARSPLTDVVLPVTNHYAGRPKGPVSHFTFHHMAGNLSLETCQRVLQGAGSSASYGIDASGKVACFVDEDNAPWSDGGDSNYTTVSVEMANDGGAPDWHVSDATLGKAIQLCADVLKRHGLPANASTVRYHQQYAATTCPGPYVIGQFGDIIARVARAMEPAPTGKKLTIWGFHGGLNQQFAFEPKEGGTLIRSVSSGLVLDVTGGDDKDSTKVCLWPEHGGINQLWDVRADSDPYSRELSIVSQLSGGRYLDVRAGKYQNGTDLIIFHATTGDNQDFIAVRVGTSDNFYLLCKGDPRFCLDCNM